MKHQVGDALGIDRAQRALTNTLREDAPQQVDDAPLLVARERVRDRREAHLGVSRDGEAKDLVARVGGARHLDDLANLLARARARFEHRRGLADERLGVLLEEARVQVLHVPEVRVERGPRAAGLARYLVHRRLARSEAQEAAASSLEDAFARAASGLGRLGSDRMGHAEHINT